MQILEVMHDFLDHNFQLIPGFEEKTLDENVNSMNSMYDRFNFGPLHSEDPSINAKCWGSCWKEVGAVIFAAVA